MTEPLGQFFGEPAEAARGAPHGRLRDLNLCYADTRIASVFPGAAVTVGIEAIAPALVAAVGTFLISDGYAGHKLSGVLANVVAGVGFFVGAMTWKPPEYDPAMCATTGDKCPDILSNLGGFFTDQLVGAAVIAAGVGIGWIIAKSTPREPAEREHS